jgi:DNA repair protein RecN (Recombination protein N)
MIKSINIKDFILIDELEVSFDRGLNILTGETGSGKSVIIDAIDLAFGARASKDQIRTGANKAVIELSIKLNPDFAFEFLEDNGIEPEDGNFLIISREISQNATRSRVNGVIVAQNFLQELRKFLIDIHSQHETYNYIQPKTHIDLLDSFGKDIHKELLANYKKTFSEYKSAQKELEIVESAVKTGEQKVDFLKYQIEEIAAAKINDLNEYDNLANERSVLLNAEELKNASFSSYEMLYNQENSIIDVLNSLKSKLSKASAHDENLIKFAESVDTATINLKETAGELRDYSENIEYNPERIMAIEERMDLLDKIKRKYGPSLSDVMNNLEKFEQELSLLDFSDEKLQELQEQVKTLRKDSEKLAEDLSTSRKHLSESLSLLIQEKLVKLEMPKVKFAINIENSNQLSSKGKDEVEFLISPNIGEPLKPLAKIASGGEISRVMLAIKTIFAKSDNVNTVIFDEIDTGISGKTSQAVAESLSELGFTHQVLCITHQPIIAAAADRHLLIRKEQSEETTRISITELNSEERTAALASLASGSHEDEDSLKFASSLLEQSKSFKESFRKISL